MADTAPHETGSLDADASRRQRGLIAFVRSTLQSIDHALFESSRRRVERELAKYIERSGGRLTDDIERQMTRSICSSACSWRR